MDGLTAPRLCRAIDVAFDGSTAGRSSWTSPRSRSSAPPACAPWRERGPRRYPTRVRAAARRRRPQPPRAPADGDRRPRRRPHPLLHRRGRDRGAGGRVSRPVRPASRSGTDCRGDATLRPRTSSRRAPVGSRCARPQAHRPRPKSSPALRPGGRRPRSPGSRSRAGSTRCAGRRRRATTWSSR